MSIETEKADLNALRIHHDIAEPQSGRKSMVKLISIILLVVAAIATFVIMSGTLTPTIGVEVSTVALTFPSQANAVLTASGYVVAQQKASVASKGTGRLEYLGVEEGDKIKKGQIIARLEDQDVLAALEGSKAELELANADLEDAHQSLDRQRTLFSSGLTSKAELDGAQARLNRVKASIRSAAATVRSAEVALENTRIRAPFDGTVLTKDADVGEVVAPFASSASSRGAVVTLADMSSLEVEADVSESNITRVATGQPCEITLDAYPDKRYPGYVHKIVPTADRAKATVLTKVRFKDRDERVLPEMSAKVTFLSKELEASAQNAPPKLTIPGNALVNKDGASMVFLVKDERVELVRVKLGDRIGGRVEVKEGLQQGDRIVVKPAPGLSSGAKVKIPS